MSIAQLRHERRRTQAPISHHKRHRARGWVVPGVLLQTGLTAHRARGQPSSGSTYDLAMMYSLSVARTIVDKGHFGDTSSQERKRRALIWDLRVNFIEADLVIRM
jgi:hypothetical protein